MRLGHCIACLPDLLTSSVLKDLVACDVISGGPTPRLKIRPHTFSTYTIRHQSRTMDPLVVFRTHKHDDGEEEREDDMRRQRLQSGTRVEGGEERVDVDESRADPRPVSIPLRERQSTQVSGLSGASTLN